MMRCSLCGHVFEPDGLACHASCPLGARCSLICCPNCGYQVVDEAKSGVVQVLRRLWPGTGEAQRPTPAPRPADAIPLTHVATGRPAEIATLGDMPSARAARLTAFGLAPGTSVTLLQRRPAPVVKVGETELAVSEEILGQILVRSPSPSDAAGSGAAASA